MLFSAINYSFIFIYTTLTNVMKKNPGYSTAASCRLKARVFCGNFLTALQRYGRRGKGEGDLTYSLQSL